MCGVRPGGGAGPPRWWGRGGPATGGSTAQGGAGAPSGNTDTPPGGAKPRKPHPTPPRCHAGRGGVLALGLVVMFVTERRSPAFFRGQVLTKSTPALVVED